MNYSFERSYEILERTPGILNSILSGLSDEWVMNNEGSETFSPFDVLGHLIHGEKIDWPERIKMIIEKGTTAVFVPYDRFAMFRESEGKNVDILLSEFAELRQQNLLWLKSLKLADADLEKQGLHPDFGAVTLGQLLSTWVVHDLTHIAQVTRVMAKQYKEETGPWATYFRILNF